MFKSMEQSGMVTGVECNRYVKGRKDLNLAMVNGIQYDVGQLQQRGFSGVAFAVCRLQKKKVKC